MDGSIVFARLCANVQRVPILYSRPSPFRLKIAHSRGDLDSHLMHGSLDPPVQNPNQISIGSAVFAGLTIVIDRQTDRQT